MAATQTSQTKKHLPGLIVLLLGKAKTPLWYATR